MAARLDMVYLLKYIKRELLAMLDIERDQRDTQKLTSLSYTVNLLSELADSIPDGKAIGILDEFAASVGDFYHGSEFKVSFPSDEAIDEAFK